MIILVNPYGYIDQRLKQTKHVPVVTNHVRHGISEFECVVDQYAQHQV